MTRRSVIVTGAASGVGAACARRFAGEGAGLTRADRDEDNGRTHAREKVEKGGAASFVVADVSNRLHVHNIIAEALETYGRVDALAQMAFQEFSAPFLQTSEEAFDGIVAQNLRATFLLNQAAAKQFIRQADQAGSAKAGAGAIVNLVSTEAVTAAADHVAFAATQGGLLQLTKAVALALSGHGVRVNAVGIGAIKSEIGEGTDLKRLSAAAALKRLGDPEEVAATVRFLLSDEASYITGQCVYVDGGRMIRSPAAAARKIDAD
ncbi:MAG: SDR family NAD(P)-dependent oxidoreductase [Amphiplicatus sp.]